MDWPQDKNLKLDTYYKLDALLSKEEFILKYSIDKLDDNIFIEVLFNNLFIFIEFNIDTINE